MNIYCDLDGPILDVSERYYQVYLALMRALGHEPLRKDVYWNLKRRKADLQEILSCSADEIQTYETRRLQMIELVEYLRYDFVISGVFDVLLDLKEKHRLVLVTLRHDFVSLKAELSWLKLDILFDKILAQDNNEGNWKAKFELIRCDERFCQANSIIIGDTEADILAGKKLGIPTFAVLSGIRTRELLKNLGPDYILNDITELPAYLSNEVLNVKHSVS